VYGSLSTAAVPVPVTFHGELIIVPLVKHDQNLTLRIHIDSPASTSQDGAESVVNHNPCQFSARTQLLLASVFCRVHLSWGQVH
jgi:hypothetical protein